MYITAWQKIYQRDPAPADEGFHVETKFVVNSDVQKISVPSMLLTAGKTATLEVAVSSDISSLYAIGAHIPVNLRINSRNFRRKFWIFSVQVFAKEFAENLFSTLIAKKT